MRLSNSRSFWQIIVNEPVRRSLTDEVAPSWRFPSLSSPIDRGQCFLSEIRMQICIFSCYAKRMWGRMYIRVLNAICRMTWKRETMMGWARFKKSMNMYEQHKLWWKIKAGKKKNRGCRQSCWNGWMYGYEEDKMRMTMGCTKEHRQRRGRERKRWRCCRKWMILAWHGC
jgi:hypothetical protein